MSRLKKMTIAGVAAGVVALGGIVGTVTAGASAATPLADNPGCQYWWDVNTFGATCKTEFRALAKCKGEGEVQHSEWLSGGKTAYIYCWDKGGYEVESGHALTR